jgi:DNA-binding NtrC family response regulator
MERDWLTGKRILVVDDDPDILDTVEDLLSMCKLKKASTFDEAKELLETEYFDLAILDIMGVNGFKLLEIAAEKRVIATMLTANAFNPESTLKSFKEGAAYYIPKEKMNEIATYLNDIFEAVDIGKAFWERWLDRFAGYYEEKFGDDWKKIPHYS